LGPNGAGKTTTLKIFSSMIRASHGKAFINGINVNENKKLALASCGVLIETPEIYPSLTARQALMMFAEIKGIPHFDQRQHVIDVAEQVKMSEWLDKSFGTFSRGMKQRINLAAAIIGNPNVLLLDEPTSGLDPRGMAEFRDIINRLKRDRLIFMSSHLLSEVANLCDEVAIINKGNLLDYDTIKNITSRLPHSRIFDIRFSRPLNEKEVLPMLNTIVPDCKIEKLNDKNIRIQFDGDIDIQEKIIIELVNLNTGLIGFNELSTILEDIYLTLITEGF
jgi:ABC-2 type transport system ATP-binding protein